MLELAQTNAKIELQTRRYNTIQRVALTKDPGALHYFVTVWLTDETMHVIYFRNIQYPPPPAEELIGMSLPTAKQFLEDDLETTLERSGTK